MGPTYSSTELPAGSVCPAGSRPAREGVCVLRASQTRWTTPAVADTPTKGRQPESPGQRGARERRDRGRKGNGDKDGGEGRPRPAASPQDPGGP